MPAQSTLKPSRRATIAPPIKLPNIGMRQNTPVIKPNGKARPGEIWKQRQIMNTATAVAQALIRATVTALETYFDTVSARRLTTCLARWVFLELPMVRQKVSTMLGPSVSIKKASTSARITTAKKLPTLEMEAVSTLPKSPERLLEKLWTIWEI